MSVLLRFPATLTALVLAAACSSGRSSGPEGDAELRVLHASPALGPLDVQIGGVTVIHGLTYGTTSALVKVPDGPQHLVFKAFGYTLGELDPTLTLLHVNSVVVANGTPQFLDVVTPDTGQTAGNRANVRMVNVVGANASAPTLLDVLVKAPNANPDSVIRFGVDTRIARYGSLMYFDPGHFNFKYVPAGGSTVLAEVSFDVAAGEKKAVVLERADDGTYRVQLIVEP